MAIVKSQIAIAGGIKEAPPAIKSEAVKVDISTATAAEGKTPAAQSAIEQMVPAVEGPAGRFGELSDKPDVAASFEDATAGNDEQVDDGGLGLRLSMEDDRSITHDDAVAMIEADGAADDGLDLGSLLPGYRSEAEIDALRQAGLQDQQGNRDTSVADRSGGGDANAAGDGIGGGRRSEGELLSLHEQKEARDGGTAMIAEGTGFGDAMTNFIVSKTEGSQIIDYDHEDGRTEFIDADGGLVVMYDSGFVEFNSDDGYRLVVDVEGRVWVSEQGIETIYNPDGSDPSSLAPGFNVEDQIDGQEQLSVTDKLRIREYLGQGLHVPDGTQSSNDIDYGEDDGAPGYAGGTGSILDDKEFLIGQPGPDADLAGGGGALPTTGPQTGGAYDPTEENDPARAPGLEDDPMDQGPDIDLAAPGTHDDEDTGESTTALFDFASDRRLESAGSTLDIEQELLDEMTDASADEAEAEAALDIAWHPAEIATPGADLQLYGA